MKLRWIWVVFLGILLSGTVFLPGTVFGQSHVAVVKSLTGKVNIHREEKTRPARVGERLDTGDLMVTSTRGYCGIMFTDGTVITLGPETRFRITTYVFSPETATYDFLFYLERGEAIYNSGKISNLSPESVKLNTPKATVGIRGTRFIVKVD